MTAVFRDLYSDLSQAQQRAERVVCAYRRQFGGQPRLFSAPGRAEIAGNHTDHQNGCAIAMAVDWDILAAANARQDKIVHIVSLEGDTILLDLSPKGPVAHEQGTSAAIIRGIAHYLTEQGYSIGGFCAVTHSLIPIGAGLSSSAAWGILLGTIWNALFCGGTLDAVTLAAAARYSENVYFGKPSGWLDQLACALGGFSYIDFRGDKPACIPLKVDMASSGYRFCIVDTGDRHDHLTDAYAAVTMEMRQVAAYLGCTVLRESSRERLMDCLPQVRAACGDRAVLRALNFFDEQERVHLQRRALEAGDMRGFRNFMVQSGNASMAYLQNVLPPGDGHKQGLALALYLSEQMLRGRGAWRVHGGGFAGTMIAWVPVDDLESYCYGMERALGSGCCYIVQTRALGGVEIVG